MRNTNRWAAALLAGLALAAAACDDASSTEPLAPDAPSLAAANDGRVYDQVEFLGNPLVSEVTIAKANHEAYNKAQPYATSTFRPQTEAFVVNVAGRPQSLAETLGGVLYPDMLVVDTSKDPSTAGWLSWALAGGYGGRKLSDDVVDLGLTAIFSSFFTPTGASCAPFQLPLCTDNVGANDRPFSSTFPYLAAPNS